MGSQQAEGIAVIARGQRTRLVRFEEFPCLGHRFASTCQISPA